VILLFFIALLVLFYTINNIAAIYDKQKELASLHKLRDEKRLNVERLKRQLEAIVDDNYIEEFAQERLGLRRSSEILFYNNIYD